MEIGNGFFHAWLGETLIYSAALWGNQPGHEAALDNVQMAKLDWHLANANLGPESRLLDIGCGWGSLMVRALETKNITEAVGLTVSEEQRMHISKIDAGNRITVQACPWQDFKTDKVFDLITSFEALEHSTKSFLDKAEKVRTYSRFFSFCHGLLADRGMISLQVLTWMDVERGSEIDHLPSVVVPNMDLCRLGEIVEASAPYFHMLEYHDRPDDYRKTLRIWTRRLSEKSEQLEKAHGAEALRKYERGLNGFLSGYENGTMGLARMKFVKRSKPSLD